MSNKAFKRVFLGLLALYGLLFVARAIYDLTTFSEMDIATSYNVYYAEDQKIRNYASQKVAAPSAGGTATSGAAYYQQYEQIASISARTTSYDSDLARFQEILNDNQAVVQMENRRGLPGSRRLDMVVGVWPENFDAMESALHGIGRITSSTVTVTDKSQDYQQMLAEKATLERRLASYEDLKTHSGSIPDLLQLEEKIIEMEAEIQQQLVRLGEYSEDNSLCTINYSLSEGSEAGVPRKLWNALRWSTQTYILILLGLLFVAFVAFVLSAVWNTSKRAFVDNRPHGQPKENVHPQEKDSEPDFPPADNTPQ